MNFGFSDQSLFDAAVSKCELLSEEEACSFIQDGYVVVKGAFSQGIAERITSNAWSVLKRDHEIEQSDPSTWRQLPHGYIRTAHSDFRIHLESEAPRALAAQADIVGGRTRLPQNGSRLGFSSGIISNFCVDAFPAWKPPNPKQNGWHKDGWHFRHFLDSPEQGLLTVPLYTEILPKSGGTFIAKDSIAHVARLLAAYPQGFHADSVQGSGYLIPYLIEQCSEFEELIGEPGDMVILHPFMMHRVSINPTDRPRFIANNAVVLNEPMCFNREAGDDYSLAELVVLHALGESAVDFHASRPREAYIPGPFRDEENAKIRRAQLIDEMQAMLKDGIVTPTWGRDHGYLSNNPN